MTAMHKDGAQHIDTTTWKWGIAVFPSDSVDPKFFSSRLSFIAESERLAWRAYWRLSGGGESLDDFIARCKSCGDRTVNVRVEVVE